MDLRAVPKRAHLQLWFKFLREAQLSQGDVVVRAPHANGSQQVCSPSIAHRKLGFLQAVLEILTSSVLASQPVLLLWGAGEVTVWHKCCAETLWKAHANPELAWRVSMASTVSAGLAFFRARS